ncbi:AAA family ATPase [Pseudanabaena sp. FACHB-1998]|uniref:AAA family ATPase n=1 Tax=Pseudanabaena sp. FACHB-1998 TaxID=2692858 RepID=UPI0016813BF8|nr:AAA family ATPase [Pseudanabaena sp. FACHB-1998]MBD2178394.1 AAA family ATPase [Pseudanabaena sp. FACHB-1998]
MFNIQEHVAFNRNRAQCPNCLADGKHDFNLVLLKSGAYKCHRGCTTDQIREALGHPKEQTSDRIIPTALAKQPKTVTHTQEQIDQYRHDLINRSKHAINYLKERGFTADMANRYQLGVAERRVRNGKTYEKHWCIAIPYQISEGVYMCKYRVAPWLADRPEKLQKWSQDTNLQSRFHFTKQDGNEKLFIVAGDWDAMTLAEIAITENQPFDICTNTTGEGNIPDDLSPLERYKEIYIFYDLDKAGDEGSQKIAQTIGDRTKICTVPHPQQPKEGYDSSDAIASGYKFEDFIEATKTAIAPNKPKNDVRDRLITTQELLDRAPDFVEFLVHDLITSNELQIIAAPPRAGKSLLSLGLVESVASGKEFLGRPTQQGDVIYVNCEDGDSKLKERVLAQGWDPNIPVHWLTEFNLSEWDKLLEVCEDIKPKLLVIDTLTSVRSDDTDENSSKVANLLKPLKQAAKRLNMAVILVHHTKKLNVQSLSEVDVFDTMRGSGVIRSESRGAIVLAEVANTETRRNEWRLIAENGSYGKQDLLVVLDANTLSWKCLSNWTPNCSESQEAQALAFFDKVGSASIQQVSENTSIPAKSAYTVVTRLVQRGMLTKQGTRQNAVYIRAIQHIQQFNSLLNSPNPNSASDAAPNSTKDKNIFSTDTQVLKTVDVTAENMPMPQSVELEAQTLTQQPIPNSTSNSTQFNKPRSVKSKQLKVGDRVRIKAGGLSGKIGTVDKVTEVGKGKAKIVNAVVSSDQFGMPQTIPVNHLEFF